MRGTGNPVKRTAWQHSKDRLRAALVFTNSRREQLPSEWPGLPENRVFAVRPDQIRPDEQGNA
jgi:hypothetical protein